MGTQQRNGYFSVFFKQWHFVTALLIASVLLTLLLADLEYNLLSVVYVNNPPLFVSFCFIDIIALFLLDITLVLDAYKPKINLADAFGWGFIVTAIGYLAMLFLMERKTTVRLLFVGFLFIFGLVLLILSGIAHGKAKKYGVSTRPVEKTLAGYYALIFRKYPFLSVPSLVFVISVIVFGFMNATKAGITTITPTSDYLIFSYVCLAFVAIYFLIGVFDKKVRFFDVLLLSLLVAAPVIAVETLISDITQENKNFWLILSAATFAFAILGTIIKRYRFDQTSTGKTFLFKNRNGYIAGISAKYSLIAPIAAGCALFFLTFIAFRFSQLTTYYIDYINGTIPDHDLLATPYLFINGLLLCFLLLCGLITLGSVKSKTVCIGDALILLCIAYSVISLVSIIVIPTSLIVLIWMLCVSVYVAILTCLRISTVLKNKAYINAKK